MFNLSSSARILTTGEYAEHERQRLIGELITDAQAKTIASWWEAPSGIGSVLASFASGCEVDNEELLADIKATQDEVYADNPSESEIEQLGRLMDYVESF